MNNKPYKRFLTFLLCAAMLITYMPSTAFTFADEGSDDQQTVEEAKPAAPAAEKKVEKKEEKKEEAKAEKAPAPAAEEKVETPAPEPKAEEPAETPKEEPAEKPEASGDETRAGPDETEPAKEAVDEAAEGTAEETVEETAEEALEETEEDAVDEEALKEEEEGDEEDADKEEEEEFPAQSFNKSSGGIQVIVAAPKGALPVDTDMVITPVASAKVEAALNDAVDGEVTGYKAVDITFMKNGKEVKPNEEVKVTMKVSGLEYSADKAMVHIDDNWNAEEVAGATVSKSGVAKVETGDFSIYAVVTTGDNARLKVIFKNGDSVIASTIVKKSDINATTTEGASLFDQLVYDPGAGQIGANKVFRGWTQKEDYTEADIESGMNIDAVRNAVKAKLNAGVTEVSGNPEEIVFYAMVFKTVNITYKDEDNVVIKNVAVLTKSGGEVEHEVSENYIPKTSDQEFQGWYFTTAGSIKDVDGNTIPEGSFIPNETMVKITDDLILSVKAPVGAWLIFKENLKGASYTPPQFLEGEAPEEPSDPTAFGYTFGGWYTDAACTEGKEFDFTKVLEKTTTIYAKWTPNTKANYSVIIWKQSVEGGDKYDFAELISLEGNVGDTIDTVVQNGSNVNTGTEPSQTRNVTVNGEEKSYTGFHCADYDKNVKIVTEGTSVVNVYYDRNTITIKFNAGGYYWGWDYYYLYVKDEKNGGYANEVTYTGLYEAPLTFSWPTERAYDSAGTDRFNTLWYYESYPRDTVLSFIGSFKLPDNSAVSLTLHGTNSGSSPLRIYLMDEEGHYATDEEDADKTINMSGVDGFGFSEKYTGFKLDQYRYKYRSYGQDHWSEWITATEGGEAPDNARELEIRYKRIKGKITYMDGAYVDGTDDGGSGGNPIEDEQSAGKLHESEEMFYEADVSSYGEGGADYYKPTRAGYVFDGWYADEGCTQKYRFTKMPADGITVYAKWRIIQYRVFLHPNVPTTDVSFSMGGQSTSFRIDYGESISKINGTRDDYELVGWYTDSACKHPFNFDAFVANDTTVTTGYDKSKSTELDKYGNPTENTNADVNRKWITRELNLYAKWRSKLVGANGITVVYDAGDGKFSGEGSPSTYTDLLTYKDLSKAVATTASTPNDAEHYEFESWEIYKYNGSDFVATGETVLPGDSFEVKKAYTQRTENEGHTEQNPSYTYTFKLVAKYKKLGEETKTHITWYSNTTSPKAASKSDDNLSMNETVPIEPASLFTYDGYEFVGWARYDTESEPEGPTDESNLWLVWDGENFKENGTVVTKVAADEKDPYHDLYAVWKKLDELNYNKNGGSGNQMAPSRGKTGTEVDVKANAYTAPAGKKFKEWNTKDDGTGTSYKANDKYKLTAGDDVLYAIWEPDEAATYTVT